MDIDSQSLRKKYCFLVRDTSETPLDLGDGVLGNIPAQSAALGSQHGLGQPVLAPEYLELLSYDVLTVGHLPELEVDPT